MIGMYAIVCKAVYKIETCYDDLPMSPLSGSKRNVLPSFSYFHSLTFPLSTHSRKPLQVLDQFWKVSFQPLLQRSNTYAFGVVRSDIIRSKHNSRDTDEIGTDLARILETNSYS